MRTLCFLAFALTACSKSAPDCEKIFDKTVAFMPADMQEQLKGKKDEAIAKCEKSSPEAKQCAADANTMEDLMKCPRK